MHASALYYRYCYYCVCAGPPAPKYEQDTGATVCAGRLGRPCRWRLRRVRFTGAFNPTTEHDRPVAESHHKPATQRHFFCGLCIGPYYSWAPASWPPGARGLQCPCIASCPALVHVRTLLTRTPVVLGAHGIVCQSIDSQCFVKRDF
jgi:hypothetical protein